MSFNRVERACAVILENNQLLLLEEDGYPEFAGGGIEPFDCADGHDKPLSLLFIRRRVIAHAPGFSIF